jgi:hypothetical protein
MYSTTSYKGVSSFFFYIVIKAMNIRAFYGLNQHFGPTNYMACTSSHSKLQNENLVIRIKERQSI